MNNFKHFPMPHPKTIFKFFSQYHNVILGLHAYMCIVHSTILVKKEHKRRKFENVPKMTTFICIFGGFSASIVPIKLGIKKIYPEKPKF